MNSQPLTVWGIVPAWGLPCVSPFVTKVVYGLQLARVPYTLQAQNPLTLRADSPNGKVPHVRQPDGQKLADSPAILAAWVPEPACAPSVAARNLAVHRLVDEHLYWHAVIEPRWADDTAWLRYRSVLLHDDHPPEAACAYAEGLRQHVLMQWRGCGLGMLPPAQRAARARQDVQALATLVDGPEPFLSGQAPGHADLAVAAMCAHALEAPFASVVADEAQSHPALAAHLGRVRACLAG